MLLGEVDFHRSSKLRHNAKQSADIWALFWKILAFSSYVNARCVLTNRKSRDRNKSQRSLVSRFGAWAAKLAKGKLYYVYAKQFVRTYIWIGVTNNATKINEVETKSSFKMRCRSLQKNKSRCSETKTRILSHRAYRSFFASILCLLTRIGCNIFYECTSCIVLGRFFELIDKPRDIVLSTY